MVSNDFPTFEINASFLLPEYLGWLSRTNPFVNECRRATEGTTNRVRLKVERFKAIQIRFPPVDEQRRIVSPIEFYTYKIGEANGRKKRILPELHSLQSGAYRDAFVKTQRSKKTRTDASDVLYACIKDKAALSAEGVIPPPISTRPNKDRDRLFAILVDWRLVRFEDICRSITAGTNRTPTYTESGSIFLSTQDVKPYRFMPEYHRSVSEEDYEGYVKNVKPERGDILMTRVGTGIGKAAEIDRDLDFAIYVSLCLIKPLRSFPSVSFLVHWLNSAFGVRAASEKTLGCGSSQGNLNLKLIREFVIPVPPADDHHKIVGYLDRSRACFDQLKDLRDGSAISIDALLHSILDRAF